MQVSFWNRIQGRSIREIYLYIDEKLVKRIRNRIYAKMVGIHPPLRNHIKIPLITNDDITSSDLWLADSYCNHTFDLLGSGPTKVKRKTIVKIEQIQEISSFEIIEIIKRIKMLNPDYEEIEWQEDFKNNHLFNVLQSSESIQNNESNGFDIKIPWELARCQHHPFLARLYRLTREKRLKREVLCEILDFIAYNPVGYGVNWKCAMDVAIRVSNWIMALDIIQDNLDNEIERIISKSIYEHCVYIRYHLEDQRDYRGNHYLSDIVGLLYSSTFFSPEGGLKKIQEFAINQLFSSIDEQFYKDGGNFESSLPYHRLSLELAVYGLWRILALADYNDLCYQYSVELHKHKREVEKVGRAFKMMLDAIKPNGDIYQLGDNDSGHLFRFYHFGELLSADQYTKRYGHKIDDSTWDENELSCREIEAVIRSVFDKRRNDTFFSEMIGNVFQSSGIYAALSKAYLNMGNETQMDMKTFDTNELPFIHIKKIAFDKQISTDDIQPFYYPNFGLVGLRNDSFYLGVSITGVGQHGRGGHSHNDKLSYELLVNGVEFQKDPGTYVYTESRDLRNKFRSSLAHNSPYFGEEQNLISENCFELKQRTECELMELSEKLIRASCKYGSIYVIRSFELSGNKLVITDYSNTEFVDPPEFEYFSNGYGKIIKQKEKKNND